MLQLAIAILVLVALTLGRNPLRWALYLVALVVLGPMLAGVTLNTALALPPQGILLLGLVAVALLLRPIIRSGFAQHVAAGVMAHYIYDGMRSGRPGCGCLPALSLMVLQFLLLTLF